MRFVQEAHMGFAALVVTMLVLPGPALSSSAPPLKPNEQIVKTRDGCGFVVDTSSPSATYESEAKSRLTWGGPCVDGLAMGEGWISEGDYRYISVMPSRGLAWYGRIFGAHETRIEGGAGSSAFVWDGKHVSYNTLSTTKPVWGRQRHERSSVSDGNTLVFTNSRGCILEAKTLPECKQDNKFDIPGVMVLDLQTKKSAHYNCPNPRSTQGCEALWAEHAGPVIERIKAFMAENEPKAEARKREIAPLIARWRPSPQARQNDAARHAALRSAQLAEREKREAANVAAHEKHKREMEKLQRETDALRAENAAAAKKAEEERARDRRETLNMLGNAAVAASGGKNAGERRKLALESLAQEGGGSSLPPSQQTGLPASQPVQNNSQSVSSAAAGSGSKSFYTEFENSKWCSKVFTISDTPETRYKSRSVAFGVRNECSYPVYIFVRADETGRQGCERYTGLDYEYEYDRRLQQTIDTHDGTAIRNHGKYYRPGEETRTKPIRLGNQSRCGGWKVDVVSACATEEEMARRLKKLIVRVFQKDGKDPISNCVAQEYASPFVPTAR